MGLRLGTTLCHPHSYHHCGTVVNNLGTHGLSCKRSEGRHHRHSAINYIVHRALTTAYIPSRLEPAGLSRVDGNRPGGITVVPWKQEKLLVWDATCSDTFGPSYVDDAAHGAGNVATAAEARKKAKYSNLSGSHVFVPVAIEMSGVLGPETGAFVKELRWRLRQVTRDELIYQHIVQCLSIAVLRGNAASVMGSVSSCEADDYNVLTNIYLYLYFTFFLMSLLF